jgi:hypothetical protein
MLGQQQKNMPKKKRNGNKGETIVFIATSETKISRFKQTYLARFKHRGLNKLIFPGVLRVV